MLLNHITRWCVWADMTIRVEKCMLFEIKKSSNSSIQFCPKLLINQNLVPAVNIGRAPLNILVVFSFFLWITMNTSLFC